jgi:hypothetical protein
VSLRYRSSRGWLLKNMVRNRCGVSTCFSTGRLGDVELRHEFAVGGGCAGEVLVAFFELRSQFDDLLFERRDLL